MKRLFKKLARTLWWMSSPLRRPLVRKFDRHMVRLLGSVTLHTEAPTHIDLSLTSVVRELARLQIQVEILQQQIEDLQSSEGDGHRAQNRLTVIGGAGSSRS
jgi:hypothetical protein